jgi:Uma2 family endonuclease
MTLAPPASEAQPAPSDLTADGLPHHLVLPPDLRLTPEQFALVCEANPEAVLELSADGQLIAMTPTGGETGARNHTLSLSLGLAARASGLALKLFDSSTGFRLSDGSVLSPDAAVVRAERWQALTHEQRRGFPPLCPDLVVELVSPSDEGPRGADALRRKMAAYLANGAQLGWLLFPEQKAVEIWQAETEGPVSGPRRLEPASRLEGGTLFPALVLDLEEIWAG